MSWFQLGDNAHNLTAAPDVITYIGSFPVTNTLLMVIINMALVGLLCVWVASFRIIKPSRAQLAFEAVILYLDDFFAKVVGNAKLAREIVPITGALVVYLLLNNLIPVLLPFLSAFTIVGVEGHEVPLLRIAPSDVNVALAFSFGMFVVANVYALQKVGFIAHITKFIQIPQLIQSAKGGLGSLAQGILNFFIGLLELISELARIFSLCLRLFGNIFAGEILLMVALKSFGIGLPAFVLLFGLLVGTIQAIVFGSLVSAKLAEFGQTHH